MAKALIIVESPAKARTIGKLAGKDYDVIASNGHVRDLPKSKLGVDIDSDFEPQYISIRSKSKVIKDMRAKAKTADEILLAPDLDREGEAIAWHLTQVLKIKEGNFKRLVFHEITKKAIQESLNSPLEINMDKVNAQQARRVLDRLVGYQLSPVLWKTIRYGLSAGRVQSVALRLIVDREREISAFNAVEYWTIQADVLSPEGKPLRMGLVSWDGNKPEITKEEEAKAILGQLKDRPLEIVSLKTRRRRRNPTAPFITSTMQQEAFRALRFSSKKTMKIAQELYEGIEIGGDEGTAGLITYMRTDSTRVADEAIEGVRGYIEQAFGKEYLPEAPAQYTKKGRSQDAHEAVRPTDPSRAPETIAKFLSADQLKLYTLVWRRFTASQMRPQEVDVTSVDAACDKAIFRASGRVIVFDGFTRLYETTESETDKRNKKEKDKDSRTGISGQETVVDEMPKLKQGNLLQVKEYLPKQHFTEPPPRFSEASLIRAMEENGIGRPSTYSTIVSTIVTRDYIKREKGRLTPTDLGITVVDLLTNNFSRIMNVDFTAHMEEELDRVEEGQDSWVDVVREFYTPFRANLDIAEGKIKELKEEVQKMTDVECEECNSPMLRKFGRNGPFLACSKYPECKFTQPLNEDEKPQLTDHSCPKCESAMMIRTGRYGRFLACSEYPECKTTLPVPAGVDCPEADCAGGLVEKRTRTGRVFYGCNKYPACKYALWEKPELHPCPECKHPFMVARDNKKVGPHYACPKCKALVPREQTVEETKE
jgi:DNA topoisomerase I